ncbi:alkaline phosphatase D family protein, partial [Acidobacteriota bacterium]
GTAKPHRFRKAMGRGLRTPSQSRLYRSTPVAYTWDDHDFGPDNSDRTSPSREAAATAYRQVVPHYPLPAGNNGIPIYQAFTIGRVHFIMIDGQHVSVATHHEPDGPEKSMLGEEQKQWLKDELLSAREKNLFIVWANGVPWIVEPMSKEDTWGHYHHERQEIARFIEENDLSDRMLMVSGDAHMLAIDGEGLVYGYPIVSGHARRGF